MQKGGVGKIALILALGLGFLIQTPALAQSPTSTDQTAPIEEHSQYGTYDRVLVKTVQHQSIVNGTETSQTIKYTIEFLSGKRKGQSFTFSKMQNEPDLARLNPQAGDRLVAFSQIDLNSQPKIYFENYDRYPIYFWIFILLAIALFLLAGTAGLRIGLFLALSLLIVNYVLLPLGMKDWPAIIITLISFSLLSACGLLLFKGWNKKSLASLLGVLLGISVTCLTVSLFSAWAHLSSPANETNQNYFSGLGDLQGIFLLGILLATFAIIQDICVSIIAGIAELKRVNPNSDLKSLFKAGMSIGWDHLGTMAPILTLASLGFALPAIATQISAETDWLRLLNMDLVAQTLILPIAALFGIILAIPLCCLVGSLIWTRGAKPANTMRRALVWRAAPMAEEDPKNDLTTS
ncbi:MAG: YibE/F family protein [Patescibacteria group bacterium]